jgi:hypothetical protein
VVIIASMMIKFEVMQYGGLPFVNKSLSAQITMIKCPFSSLFFSFERNASFDGTIHVLVGSCSLLCLYAVADGPLDSQPFPSWFQFVRNDE